MDRVLVEYVARSGRTADIGDVDSDKLQPFGGGTDAGVAVPRAKVR